MITKLLEMKEVAKQKISEAKSIQELNETKAEYLGKKSPIQALFGQMKDLSVEEKKELGQKINEFKGMIEEEIAKKLEAIKEEEVNKKLQSEAIDVTLPGKEIPVGNLHVLSKTIEEMEEIFTSMGYEVAEGPEVEMDLYNFEMMNLPKNHPARDMQDSFYINPNILLRTHTSPVQARTMLKAKGEAIKVICPGKVYRRDDDDATHSHQFTQIEGLVVGENIRLSDLKGTLEFVAKKMFGEKRTIRFRPSYFQFTEPSVEVDVSCHMCGGKGCPTCKGTGWIEILGAGMVHPNVLRMAGYDPEKCSGFAFGIGGERVAMLKYGVDDIRHFYTNDMRFNKTFTKFE